MPSTNRLVVEVVGDVTGLTRDLNTATTEINRFAGRSKIHTKVLDPTAEDVRRQREEFEQLKKREAEVAANADAVDARFRKMAVGAGIAGLAVNRLGANLSEFGGNADKIGSALSDLTSGNIVGFVKGLQSVNAADPGKIADDLLRLGDAAKAQEQANALRAAGFDSLADSAQNAANQIRSATDAFVDNTKIRDSTSVGAIAAETSSIASKAAAQRKGITQSQRNAFFDNDITRALDRAQDGELRDQVTKLKAVEQTLRDRLKVTKDITRQLRLEDEIVGVQRQQRTIEDTIAANAKARAEAAARAAEALRREQQERAKALEEARKAAIQAKQFRALGFAADGSEVVPGADNLRKQLASLTDRLGSSSVNLSSKLEAQLEGVRKVLSGKFGQVTRESRDRIQGLFDTIRKEFDKGAQGPLTKTHGLDTSKILQGLGLDTATSGEIRARLSGFNTAGRANAGSFGGGTIPIVESHVTVQLPNGDTLAKTVTRSQQKTKARNPAQRRGPNRGKF